VMRAASAKFGLHAGNKKLDKQNEEQINVQLDYKFASVFVYTPCAIKVYL